MEHTLQQGDMLTVIEAAELVRARPRTVLAWIQRGKLSCSRPGRYNLIRRADLEILLAEKATRRVAR